MRKKEIITLGVGTSIAGGLQGLFSLSKDYRITKTYAALDEAVNGIMYDSFDLLIVELTDTEYKLTDFFKYMKLSSLSAKFVVISYTLDSRVIRKCIEYGADGIVYADNVPSLMFRAVEKVLRNEVFICSTCLNVLVKSFRLVDSPTILSTRELEILELLSMGKSYQEVASQLFISVETVKSHAHSVYKKLNVRNKSEAVIKARHHKMLQ